MLLLCCLPKNVLQLSAVYGDNTHTVYEPEEVNYVYWVPQRLLLPRYELTQNLHVVHQN